MNSLVKAITRSLLQVLGVKSISSTINKTNEETNSSITVESDSLEDQDCDYCHNQDELPIEYQDRRLWIKEWYKQDGDFVRIDEPICEWDIENLNNKPIIINAPRQGILEIKKHMNLAKDDGFIQDGDLLFSIYDSVIDDQREQLKSKRPESIPIISRNEFDDTFEIRWRYVSAQKPKRPNSILPSNNDSIVMHTDIKERPVHFIFISIIYSDSLDTLILRSPSKYNRLQQGDLVQLLFENKETIDLNITSTPYKTFEDVDFGWMYETKIPLSAHDLKLLTTQNVHYWQFTSAKSGLRARGSVPSDALFKFCNEYMQVVKDNIIGYSPGNNHAESTSTSIPNEECYVYIMLDTVNNYHKIGISSNPSYRERTLQSEKPTIELIASKQFPSRNMALSFEQALHNNYSDKRIRGEWFNLGKQDINELYTVLNT